ncbi:MAG: nucleotidyltransferase family protein [Vicinamibacterales bacterium]|jgi:molybdenum cofactor cytidylyltransferase
MTAGIILAAGNSTRMGSPKALLPDPDGRPFVARLTRTFSEAGVAEIYIVTGSQHDAIVAAVAADRPTAHPSFLNNPKPDRGQLSSLWIGLDAAVRPEVEAILVTPVDIPMVHASTIRQIVEVWQRQRAPVVRPAVGVRHGHPVLFDRSLFDELRKAPLDQGARAVVHAHADRIVNVPVEDEGCLVDVDTPADYDALMRDAT